MFTLKIDTDQPNGIFENGQHIQPFVLIDNHSDNSLTGQLMWRVTTDTGEFLEETTVTVHPTPRKQSERLQLGGRPAGCRILPDGIPISTSAAGGIRPNDDRIPTRFDLGSTHSPARFRCLLA